MLNSLLLIALLLSAPSAQATLVTTSLKLDIARPYEGEPLTLKGYQKDFNKQIIRIESKKYKECVRNNKLPQKTPDILRVWWSYIILKCANQAYKKKQLLRPFIKAHIEEINKYKGDLTHLGSHLGAILVRLANSKNYIISDLEKNFLVKNEVHLKNKDLAKFYSFLGARFDMEKKPGLAAQYYFKALDLDKQPSYSTRLKTVLNKNKDLQSTYKDFYQNFSMGSSKIGRQSFSSFFAKRNSLAKVKEGVRLLNKYDSTKYKVISKIYRISKKKLGLKFNSAWAKAIKKCHNPCLVKFAERYYQAHNYDMSRAVAEVAYKLKESARAKIVSGLSNVQQGKYEEAVKNYKQAKNLSASKSKDFFESTFRLGLLYYRLKSYDKAIAVLNNLEDFKELNDYNLQTTYWLWRSLQKIQSDKATVVRNRIIKLYPLTYYGLLANYEKNKQKISLPTNMHVFQKNMKWTSKQLVSWENYNDFIKMQLFYLAKKELKILFNIKNDQEAVLYSHFSSLAADHYTAIKTMNVIWDKNPYINFTKNTTKLTLPTEYKTIVNEQAEKYNVETSLVNSLIKQESSFGLKAVSSSNAMGLMQLVPITIKDSAGYLRINKKRARKEIFEPAVNVRLGTSYLYRMINAFEGHVPLALAAYNAGIGNIRRWIKKRPDDLGGLAARGLSSVEDEIWIDELPWAETSFYVKAILRNLVLYRFYYEGIDKIPKPVWQKEPAPVL